MPEPWKEEPDFVTPEILAIFSRLEPCLQAFADESGMGIEKYYKGRPTWDFRGRTEAGWEAHISFTPSADGCSISSSWHKSLAHPRIFYQVPEERFPDYEVGTVSRALRKRLRKVVMGHGPAHTARDDELIPYDVEARRFKLMALPLMKVKSTIK
jgi:hypothetical protein